MSEQPHPTDLFVGNRIRSRRRALGMSQEALADSLDLTFQQVQKYERGANRVSASKLLQISHSLSVQIGFFFEGLQVGEFDRNAAAITVKSEEAFAALPQVALVPDLAPWQRRLVGKLIEGFAENGKAD